MKKKHIYVAITFILLTILTVGLWKGIEQANLQKYVLDENKISKYQEELRNTLISTSDELIQEMTESYQKSAQKEYEKRLNNQTPIIQVILISVSISALVCAIIEFVLFIVQKKKASNVKENS